MDVPLAYSNAKRIVELVSDNVEHGTQQTVLVILAGFALSKASGYFAFIDNDGQGWRSTAPARISDACMSLASALEDRSLGHIDRVPEREAYAADCLFEAAWSTMSSSSQFGEWEEMSKKHLGLARDADEEAV